MKEEAFSQKDLAEDHYKEMYLTMARAAKKAIRILQKAQEESEELFLAQGNEKESEE